MGSEVKCVETAAACGFLQDPPAGTCAADFHHLAEALPHMVWVCKPDGTLDYMNTHGRDYFGASLYESVKQFPGGGIAHPDDAQRALHSWEEALQAQDTLSVEARFRRSDGAFRWHLICAKPVRDDRGQVTKWLGSASNVHDVREGEHLSAFLLELSTDFTRMDNPHELVCAAMARLRERLGAAQVTLVELDRTRGEAVILRQNPGDGSNLEVLSLPLQPFESLLSDAKRGLVTVLHDTREHAAGASLYDRWYGLNGVGAAVSAPLLHGGSLVALLTVADTVQRKWSAPEIELIRRVAEIVWPALEKARSDYELAVSGQRLRLAQAVAQIGAWELDPQSHSIFLSGESYELFGLPADAPDLYQHWMSAIDPRDRHTVSRMVEECALAEVAEAEYRYRHPKRGIRWIFSRAGKVADTRHNCIVGISLDVTDRRQAQEALKDINQRKDEFLAMLAHELRNPLAPIRNAAQILRAHSNEQPQLEWAGNVIERQTRHLVRLVDDLLDVSRMVRGKIVLRIGTVELSELVQHAVDTSQPLIRSRLHHLHVSLPVGAVTLDGDLTRLAQALGNLLNNAAEYTDEGGDIWLDAWYESRQVILRVRDTGPGIAAALLPHVFDLFTQAERTLDRPQGGLGIGLTLVKLLSTMHGGSVEARNLDPGPGAEFVMRLPADGRDEVAPGLEAIDAVNAANSQGDPAAGIESPMRILVVDDNVDAAESIALLLSIDGFEAHSVYTAASALETVDSFNPDVVLLDIGLPLMDGYEVARRLRARIPVEKMKIVALSGYGQQADRHRAAQAGFDDYLVKPVEPAVLNDFLRAL